MNENVRAELSDIATEADVQQFVNAFYDGVMPVTFKIDGQEFLGLNGGPAFKFSPAISFMVNCKDQKEIDYYWDKLIEGGAPMECGWLTDKYGMSWQIVPAELSEMMKDPNPRKSERAMSALLKMVKLDIAEIRKAYEQE